MCCDIWYVCGAAVLSMCCVCVPVCFVGCAWYGRVMCVAGVICMMYFVLGWYDCIMCVSCMLCVLDVLGA